MLMIGNGINHHTEDTRIGSEFDATEEAIPIFFKVWEQPPDWATKLTVAIERMDILTEKLVQVRWTSRSPALLQRTLGWALEHFHPRVMVVIRAEVYWRHRCCREPGITIDRLALSAADKLERIERCLERAQVL